MNTQEKKSEEHAHDHAHEHNHAHDHAGHSHEGHDHSGHNHEHAEHENKHEKKESKSAALHEEKKKTKTDSVVLEREYIIPLRKGFLRAPKYRRAKKAVRLIKEFLVRHMQVRSRDLKLVKIDTYLNNELWFRGIKNPMHKIKVKAVLKDGFVHASLAEPSEYVKFTMARDAKAKVASEKIKEKKGKKEEKEEAKTDEQKTEEKEKEKATVEAGLEQQKAEAKEMKRTAKAKTGAQDKGMIKRKALKR